MESISRFSTASTAQNTHTLSQSSRNFRRKTGTKRKIQRQHKKCFCPPSHVALLLYRRSRCQCNIPWAEVPFSSGPGPKFSCTGKEMRDQASWRERRSYLCTGNKKVAPLSPFSLTQLSPFLAMSVPTLLFASAATSTFRFDNVRRRTIVRRSNSAIVDANVAINATITRQRYCTAQLQKLAPFFLMNSYHAAKVTVARRPLRGGSRDVYNPQRGL